MQEAARREIQKLVETYQQLNREERSAYTETSTRTDFIDPLFAALGWDMHHNAEVTREEASGRKRVDYAFKINDRTRFLLEAKSLTADLANPDFAKQATDYAWNRGVDWVVLTNFHELKLYFVSEYHRINPILSLGHEDFLRRFDELRLLSKDSIRDHELQKRAVGIQRRHPVDKQLYEDLAGWRRALLTNLRQFHQDWSEQQHEEATQLILNRLIFIRNVEDREIEDSQLLSMLRQLKGRESQLPAHLVKLFRDLDAVYNAQLFAKHFCEDYEGPAEPLVNMVRGLNHRVDLTPYNFAAISADVLGTIYEQYLTLAQAEQARRKQQGIYYTPRFVVHYIVRNTVVKALEAARERGGSAAARQIRVLDPACGSGSFLIAAFDVLDEWLRENDPLLRDDSAARKQHILRENLYGVDKDPQAVAVTRLNLWLRAVDQRAKLPDIPNIRHGDSLIDEEFDWPREFPNAFEAGGFDVVIGNPPYVRQESLDATFKEYARAKYRSYTGRADLYVCFYERAHELLRPGGYFGFVSSNKFMRAAYGKGLREYLLEVAELEEIIDFGRLPVFEGVAAYPSIVITQKAESHPQKQEFIYAPVNELPEDDLDEAVNQQHSILDERSLQGDSWTLAPMEEMGIFLKMQDSGVHLSEYLGKTKIRRGLTIGLNEAFIIEPGTYQRIMRLNPQSAPFLQRVLKGIDIRKYRLDARGKYLINIPKGWTRKHCSNDDPEEWMISQHPLVMNHLAPFSDRAKKRQDQGDFWWELRACAYLNEFHKPKIIYADISSDSRFSLDRENCYLTNSAYMIPEGDFYLLGVLNSKAVFNYFKSHVSALGGSGGNEGGWLRWIHQFVSRIPIPRAAADDPRRQTIERAVKQALDLAPKEAAALEGSQEKLALRHRLDRLDAEIDEAVCSLYGLTDKQIARVKAQATN